MSLGLPSFDELKKYCEKSGAIPPLFLSIEARNIMDVLSGKSSVVKHWELMDRLAKEKRFPGYQEMNTWIKMVFQDYVGVHQQRMHSLVFLLHKEYIENGIWDINEFLFWCLYHDSPEGLSVVGDIPTPIKESFSKEIRTIHDIYEQQLITLATQDTLEPKITWFPKDKMLQLSEEFDNKKTLRAQMLSYQDKLDACMVCLHEVRAWNTSFFLEKLKWYKDFFQEVLQWIRLPLIQGFIKTIPVSTPQLNELFNTKNIIQSLCDIICAQETNTRNTSIDNMFTYNLWKKATKRLENVQVWNQIMDGEQILTQER